MGGSSTDGGTSQRVGGTFLTWLNDHTSQVFVIATCNDYAKIPPEYTRMGRWDAIFFVDNPGPEEREQILKIYLDQFNVVSKGTNLPDLDGYSGAEIRQVAIEAAYGDGDIEAAGKFIIPISKSQKEEMDRLRQWAKTRKTTSSISISKKELPIKRRVTMQ